MYATSILESGGPIRRERIDRDTWTKNKVSEGPLYVIMEVAFILSGFVPTSLKFIFGCLLPSNNIASSFKLMHKFASKAWFRPMSVNVETALLTS